MKIIKHFNSNICSLPRALSKMGFCSRNQALNLILEGSVKVNNLIIKDPSFRVDFSTSKIEVDNRKIEKSEKIYLILNKPRGLITSMKDEKGRKTVFCCLDEFKNRHLFPVGRLDKASEGLLLFTNDTHWADKITNPKSKINKTYLVHIESLLSEELLNNIQKGIEIDEVGKLSVEKIEEFKRTNKNSWLKIVLDEGKNRQIRNIFESLNIKILRLLRISIGTISLGNLKKGEWRIISSEEANAI